MSDGACCHYCRKYRCECPPRYPDSRCFGGRLYDMDHCDGDGNIYEPTEYIPCPMCHPKKYVEYRVQLGWSLKAAKALTANIRNNRKNGTEPWKGAAR